MGTLIGLGAGAAISGLVGVRNALTNGALAERNEVWIWSLIVFYPLALALAGAVGGALRPWLATVRGQLVFLWISAFILYGGVQFTGRAAPANPLIEAVAIATFVTPIWLAVVRFGGINGKLRAAAGLPPQPTPEPPREEESWVVYRSTPSGGQLQVKTLLGREAAERELHRLGALGLGHRYWIERR